MILDWWFEHQNKICRVEMDLSKSVSGKIIFLGEVGGRFSDITRFTAGVSYRYSLYERSADEEGYIRTVDAVPFYGEEREMAPELLAEATLKLEEGKKLLESSSQKRRRLKILAQRAYFEDALKEENERGEQKDKVLPESKPSFFETMAKEGLLGEGKTEKDGAQLATVKGESGKGSKSENEDIKEESKKEKEKFVKINDITVRNKRYISLYYDGRLIKEYNVEEERYSEKYLSDQSYYDKTSMFFLRNIWIALIVGIFLSFATTTFLFYAIPVFTAYLTVIIVGIGGAAVLAVMLLMFPYVSYIKDKNKMAEYEIISSIRRKKHTFNKSRRKFR